MRAFICPSGTVLLLLPPPYRQQAQNSSSWWWWRLRHRSHLYSRRGKAGGGQSPPLKPNQLNYSRIILCTTRRSSPGPDFQAGLASSSRKEWMWGRMENGGVNADERGAAHVRETNRMWVIKKNCILLSAK